MIKVKSFIEGKPEIKYKIGNSKEFNKFLKQGYSLHYEEIISIINAGFSSCTRIKCYNLKDNCKNKIDEDSDEEDDDILRVEALYAPNIICIKCTKIINYKENKLPILRYFQDYKSFSNHARKYHTNEDRNNCGSKMDYFEREFSLVGKSAGNTPIIYYLINNVIIEAYKDLFVDYNKNR